MSHFSFFGKSDKSESVNSGKSDKAKDAKSGKVGKSASTRSRRFLDVDSSEGLFESMSLDLTVVSGKSYKSRTNTKSSKKATSSSDDDDVIVETKDRSSKGKSSKSSEVKSGEAKSDKTKSGNSGSGSGKAGKSASTRSRRFLDVDSSEDVIESMSLDLTIVSGKSYKSRTNAKSSEKATSSSDDEEVIVETKGKSSKGTYSKANIIVSGGSYKTRTSAKSSKQASSSDEEESSSSYETRTSAKSFKKASSSDEEELIVDMKGKSGKGDSSKADISLRFIDPSESQANGPLKSQSYIEYTRAQAPESAAEPSEESSGAMSFGTVVSLFVVALSLVTASVVFV